MQTCRQIVKHLSCFPITPFWQMLRWMQLPAASPVDWLRFWLRCYSQPAALPPAPSHLLAAYFVAAHHLVLGRPPWVVYLYRRCWSQETVQRAPWRPHPRRLVLPATGGEIIFMPPLYISLVIIHPKQTGWRDVELD